MCSLLCASDVVAAVSLVSYEKDASLYSIVFGEGITNDAVSIILFNTVLRFTEAKDREVDWKTPFNIISEFVVLGLDSLLIGLFFALGSAYLLKKVRAFTHNAVSECMLIFCFGYLSYVVSEVAE